MVPPAGVPATLPVEAVLLGRRVRLLVAVTLTHAVVLGALTWVVGGGLSGPGAVGLGVHVAVSLAAALPVWWQFAGDPVVRRRRAVRAMSLSFAGLAAYSAVDAVRDAVATPLPGEPAVGAALAVLVTGVLLVAARRERHEEVRAPGVATVPAVLDGVTAAVAPSVLLVAAASDLLAATTYGGPAVSAVVAALAAREAVRARSWVAGPPPRGTNGTLAR